MADGAGGRGGGCCLGEGVGGGCVAVCGGTYIRHPPDKVVLTISD